MFELHQHQSNYEIDMPIKRPKLCQYGNCQIETTTPVSVNDGLRKERPSFCGRTHAALYLLSQEGHRKLATDLEKQFACTTVT